MQGRFEEARVEFETALAQAKRTPDAPGYTLATHVLELAGLLCDNLDRPKDALPLIEDLLQSGRCDTYGRWSGVQGSGLHAPGAGRPGGGRVRGPGGPVAGPRAGRAVVLLRDVRTAQPHPPPGGPDRRRRRAAPLSGAAGLGSTAPTSICATVPRTPPARGCCRPAVRAAWPCPATGRSGCRRTPTWPPPAAICVPPAASWTAPSPAPNASTASPAAASSKPPSTPSAPHATKSPALECGDSSPLFFSSSPSFSSPLLSLAPLSAPLFPIGPPRITQKESDDKSSHSKDVEIVHHADPVRLETVDRLDLSGSGRSRTRRPSTRDTGSRRGPTRA